MSNIKLIFIIFINALLFSLCASEFNNGNLFFLLFMSLIGIANKKYLDSTTKLTNKQKELIKVFFVATLILFIIYISYTYKKNLLQLE
jgi:UDP-N-acetylmuramyl pentapeptide phosphotransferase/UDP-N-acetylglucosamine-1-phosphate transferase